MDPVVSKALGAAAAAVVKRLLRPPAAGAADALAFDQRYRDALVKTLDKAQLFGLQLPPEAQTYQLSTAYVSLTLRWTGDESDREAARPGRRRRATGADADLKPAADYPQCLPVSTRSPRSSAPR